MDEFYQLLVEGQVTEAIELRMIELETAAQDYKLDIDLAKATSLGASLVSVPLSLTPIGMIGAAIGLCSYAYTVYQDFSRSGKLYPLPGYRRSLGALLGGMQADMAEDEDESDLVEDVTGFLPQRQAREYKALLYHGDAIAPLLASVPDESRPLAYRYLERAIASRGLPRGALPVHPGTFAAQVAKLTVGQPPALPPSPPAPTVGTNTRLGAVPVEAAPVVEEPNPFTDEMLPDPVAVPAPPPPASVNVPVDIAVHNHLGQGHSQPTRTASPAQDRRRTTEPDLSLYPDVRERMQVLIRAMSQSGFPLGTLLNHPFVWCWGRSQSGKTTIALLLAIARMALGHKVGYLTTDDDYPRNFPWGRVEDSPEGYAVALDEARETISKASKHGLKGQGWLIDEMFAAWAEHGIKIQPILTCVLMKGAKSGAGVIGISQADTSSAHGLKGIDAAWREERVSIQAIHVEDEMGERHPTGRYIVVRGDSSEEWSLPEWMLTELNQWGQPDPAVWVQTRFPELSKVAPRSTTPRPIPRQQAKAIARPQPPVQVEPETEGDELEKLARYLERKERIDFRTLEKNWGKNNNLQGQDLRDLLATMEGQGLVAVWGDGIIWKA